MNDLQAVGWYVLYYFGQATWWLLVVLFVIGILIVILLPAYFILKAYLDKVLAVLAADAEWLAVVFEDAVVGDATSLYHKLTMFVENDDINDADTQP